MVCTADGHRATWGKRYSSCAGADNLRAACGCGARRGAAGTVRLRAGAGSDKGVGGGSAGAAEGDAHVGVAGGEALRVQVQPQVLCARMRSRTRTHSRTGTRRARGHAHTRASMSVLERRSRHGQAHGEDAGRRPHRATAEAEEGSPVASVMDRVLRVLELLQLAGQSVGAIAEGEEERRGVRASPSL